MVAKSIYISFLPSFLRWIGICSLISMVSFFLLVVLLCVFVALLFVFVAVCYFCPLVGHSGNIVPKGRHLSVGNTRPQTALLSWTALR